MNFINNWSRPITLDAGTTECPLDLPDGEWRLTLADAAGARWEIVDASVEDGAATLTRGVEGTADQEWPEGSVIYNSLTAAQIAGLMAGSGSGGGVTVSDDPPSEAPSALGQIWVSTGSWKTVSVAMGAGGAEDWLPLTEAKFETVNPNGNLVQISRGDKRLEVAYPQDPEAPVHAVTLQLPAWESTPQGFIVDIVPVTPSVTLVSLDFSAMMSPGTILLGEVLDYTGSAVCSLNGVDVDVQVSVGTRLSELWIDWYEEGGVPHLFFGMSLRERSAPVPTFIELSPA